MINLINKQAAIDEIEYEIEMINSALDSLTLDFNARERLYQRRGEAKEILNYIQQLPFVQPEPKWIPVTERLPEAAIRYQVTFESGEVGYADFRNKIFLWDGSAKENVWEIDRYYEDDGEVIAWMPRPEPYRKETEDE